MRITPEERNSQYRSCYKLLLESPRIYLKDIASKLGISRRTAMLRVQEAFERKYIVGPEIRKRSFLNLREYVYFIKCENPELLFLELRENENVIYHCQMSGFCNLFVIAKKRIKIKGTIILEGYRTDYHISYVLNCLWEKKIQNAKKKIENFNPEEYVPKGTLKSHFDQTVEWDPKDEALYRYFKYNLRKPFAPVMKKNKVSKDKFLRFLERLPEYCTIATSYFPETLSAYDHYLFMFETDYEDFLIDLFSGFPTTCWFFKVADKLFMRAYIPTKLVRNVNFQVAVNKWYLPVLMMELLERKIVKRKLHAMAEYFWAKDI
jgi:DNA-binding Lrp family transcriptional regulator